MRTPTALESTLLALPSYAVRCRVSIKDPAGAWVELTSLYGEDYVQSVEYGYAIDDQAPSCVLALRRDITSAWNSLSPLIGGSRLNNGGALLRPHAEVVVETATVPRDVAPQSGDWREVFRGLVDTIDAAGAEISLSCRDLLASELQRQWVTSEKLYSDGTGILSETLMQLYIDDWFCGLARLSSTPYVVGDRIQASPSGVFGYRCTTAGTTAASPPSFPTTPGATVADGTVVWTCIGPTILLLTPSASSWAVKGPFKLAKQPLMEALRQISDQNGWALRVLWHAASAAFRLTYLEPDRAATVPVWTFGPDDYLDVTALDQDGADVRNFVRVIYSDPADLDVDGTPKRKIIQVLDLSSIGKYGEQFLEVSEASASQIDTAAQATAYANAILADLKDLKATLAIECPYAYHLEIGDLIGFNPDSIHFDTAQKFAVVALRHVLGRGEYRTVVTCRGTPAAQYGVWLERAAAPGQSAPAPLRGPDAPTAAVASTVGGLVVTWTFSATGVPAVAAEVHIYTSSGAGLTASTLRGTVAGLRLEAGDLLSGVTYYAKVVPLDAAGNRGTASAEVSAAAGYATPATMQPIVAFGALPPNSDFEAWTLGASAAPDAWDLGGGAVAGTNVLRSTDRWSGTYALQFTDSAPVNATVTSQFLSVEPSTRYRIIVAHRRASAVVSGVSALVLWYDSSFGFISSGGITLSAVTSYTRDVSFHDSPSSARYARIRMVKDSIATDSAGWFDHFMFSMHNPPQEFFRDVALNLEFGANWTNNGAGGEERVAYRRWSIRHVVLHGQANCSNSASTTILTVPAGWRPANTHRYLIAAGASPYWLRAQITSGGVLSVLDTPPTGTWISLDGITWACES